MKFLVQKFAKKLGRPVLQVPVQAMQRLQAYSWPGNVRELQNVVERAVVLAQSNILTLGPDFAPPSPSPEPGATPPKAAAPPSADTTLDEVERRHIETALMNRNWLIEGDRGAAKVLNIHPNTLRNRMRKLGIKRPSSSA